MCGDSLLIQPEPGVRKNPLFRKRMMIQSVGDLEIDYSTYISELVPIRYGYYNKWGLL